MVRFVRILFLAWAIAAAGCSAQEGQKSQDAEPTAAYKLAVLDGEGREPSVGEIDRYQKVFESLATNCPEGDESLGDRAVVAQQGLEKEGVEESLLAILQGVQGSMPDDFKPAGDCGEIFAAYVALRTR